MKLLSNLLFGIVLSLCFCSCYKKAWIACTTQKSALQKTYNETVVEKSKVDSLNKTLNYQKDSLIKDGDDLKMKNTKLVADNLDIKNAMETFKLNYVTATSGYLEFLTPRNCDGNNDNKDDDTRVYATVTGSYGNVNPVAYCNNEDRIEFKDEDTYNKVPLTIGDPGHPNLIISGDAVRCCHELQITIYPKGRFSNDGNDTWVFKARVVFKLSDGSTVTSPFSKCTVLKERSGQRVKLY